MPNGISILEIGFRKFLVDHYDGRYVELRMMDGRGVVPPEVAPGQNRYAERREITGTDEIHVGMRGFPGLERMPLHFYRAVRFVAGQNSYGSQARIANPGNIFDLIRQLAIENLGFVSVVTVQAGVDGESSEVFGGEARAEFC